MMSSTKIVLLVAVLFIDYSACTAETWAEAISCTACVTIDLQY